MMFATSCKIGDDSSTTNTSGVDLQLQRVKGETVVVVGSPAEYEREGISVGDEVISINNVRCQSFEDIYRARSLRNEDGDGMCDVVLRRRTFRVEHDSKTREQPNEVLSEKKVAMKADATNSESKSTSIPVPCAEVSHNDSNKLQFTSSSISEPHFLSGNPHTPLLPPPNKSSPHMVSPTKISETLGGEESEHGSAVPNPLSSSPTFVFDKKNNSLVHETKQAQQQSATVMHFKLLLTKRLEREVRNFAIQEQRRRMYMELKTLCNNDVANVSPQVGRHLVLSFIHTIHFHHHVATIALL